MRSQIAIVGEANARGIGIRDSKNLKRLTTARHDPQLLNEPVELKRKWGERDNGTHFYWKGGPGAKVQGACPEPIRSRCWSTPFFCRQRTTKTSSALIKLWSKFILLLDPPLWPFLGNPCVSGICSRNVFSCLAFFTTFLVTQGSEEVDLVLCRLKICSANTTKNHKC
jgi:hypothetical protein